MFRLTTKRLLAGSLFVCVIALATAAASAGIISYDANPGPAPDPAGSAYDGYPTEAGVTPWSKDDPGTSGSATTYAGLPAWNVTDGTDNGWNLTVTASDAASGNMHGWTLTGKVALTDWSTTGMYSHEMDYFDGPNGKIWSIRLRPRSNSDGSVIVSVNSNENDEYLIPNAMFAFHTYQLVYQASGSNAGTVNFLVDGTTLGSNLASAAYTGTSSFVLWGDGTGGVRSCPAAYNFVTFQTVPEPSALVLATLGLIGLLAYAWRKRK